MINLTDKLCCCHFKTSQRIVSIYKGSDGEYTEQDFCVRASCLWDHIDLSGSCQRFQFTFKSKTDEVSELTCLYGRVCEQIVRIYIIAIFCNFLLELHITIWREIDTTVNSIVGFIIYAFSI